MIEITAPSSQVVEGAPLHSLAVNAVVLGVGDIHTTSGDGSMVIYDVPQPTDMLYSMVTPQVIAGIVSMGGSVTGYVTYIKMNKTYADATDVPSYVPGATYVDEDGNTITRKWSELTPVSTVTVDGVEYVTKEGTDGQTYWDGSVIAQLYAVDAAEADMEIMTPPQYKAWVPSEEV